MADTLEIFGVEYTNVTGIIAKDDNGTDLTFTRGGGSPTLQTKTKTYTPTTSQQTESVSADSGYDGLSAVNVTVNAMPTGTAGTPTATKGTVSNHQVSVTPSVTNTSGYITGSTINGTAVTVSASELVSGSETKTANGTYDVTNLAQIIVNVSGGGGGSASVPPKEVNFYDYDGTVVDAYTATEFAILSAMPANPTHDGLTAQGWNWTLADAQAYVAKYGRLNIGQMYVTTSGDTEIDIQLSIGRNKPYLGCCPNGTVEIDWGDGSAHDTLTGTSTGTLKSIQHTYPDTGEMFTIKLHMESGSLSFVGNSSSGSMIIYNGTTTTSNGQRAYQNAVKSIRFGSFVVDCSTFAISSCYSLTSVTIPEGVTDSDDSTFADCHLLASATIPEGVTSIGSNAFNYCYSLASLTIPENVTSIGSSAFRNCNSLTSLTIPENVTSIGSSAFQNCNSLTSLTIPENVTSIGSHAFNGCRSITNLTFKPTTPPTAGSNSFANLPSDIVVYVPAGTLSAYQSASNYSSIASKMVEMNA